MITPSTPAPTADDVARHYGDLDRWYRKIWGEHVHHGLWTDGDERPDEAAAALVDHVARRAGIGPGVRVCDVGSGYGATARRLARTRGARVTAITLSPRQHEVAMGMGPPDGDSPTYLLGDWLDNGLPSGSFDVVVAVESTEHMPDLEGALAEVRRVLRPGGTAAVCAWLAREAPGRWERRLLLEPICREGRLARLPTGPEMAAALTGAGLEAVEEEDLSGSVRRTWAVCLARTARTLLGDPDARSFLLDTSQTERIFALTMIRIWIAYRVGALRYGLFTARRPEVPR